MGKLPLSLTLLLAAVGVVSAQEPAGPALEPLLDPGHPAWGVTAPERFRAVLRTDEGEVRLEFFRTWSPHGVDRIYNLIRMGFFDDTRVYRVRDGVFAQFGLSGLPEVNEVWYTRAIPDDPRARSNRRGTVAFAMLESADTRTTQLFVNLRDNPEYDAQGFMPIGSVVEGMEVVDGFWAAYGDRAGGGMRAGRQGSIVTEGNAWLDREFPQLTRIHEARVLPGEVLRYPDVGPNRIRTELHLLPAVSSGPLDPAWSPDGERLAFSMAGDVWVIDAGGGTARALTRGPGHHFEPAWSPDGNWIAMSRDLDGNLDIVVVPAAGGEVVAVTTDPHVDVQPTWGADSATLYWASARGGDLDLWRAPFGADSRAPERLLGGGGHQFQPAVSPDGETLAFVSPVAGRPGTGGIWTVSLRDAALVGGPEVLLESARLVHWEETSFRTRPSWSADGLNLVFVSDEAGSNDLAVVPASGGAPARLTQDTGGEMAPAVDPTGARIAFVTNRSGPTRLMTAPAGGSRREGWSTVRIERREPATPTAELRLRAVDADGEAVAVRWHVVAADGRGYAPANAFRRIVPSTDVPYFHADQAVTVTVPAGVVEVEARRGPEFLPARERIELGAGERRAVVLTPTRLVDMPALGWVAGDTHSHDLHQGRWGLDHADYFVQLRAEDLHVTNALIHMDGTRLMGRWADLTGEPHPLSTGRHVLQYGQEFRGSWGHVGLLGISEFVMPLIGGAGATAFAAPPLNADWLDAARTQGGIGGYMHPYSAGQDIGASEIVLDVALGKGDFYDVANYPYDDLYNARMYWRYLNAGFRLAATGGSDNFADVWRDAPPGSARTYADTGGRIEVPAWIDAVRAARTFATNGPLLRFTLSPATASGEPIAALEVGPGEEIGVGPEATTRFLAELQVDSVAPLDRIDLVVNGEVVASRDVRALGRSFLIEQAVEIPGSGWVAAMAVGPAARAVTDGYPFAHTSPVWVVRGGRPWVDRVGAAELADGVRALWERVARGGSFPDESARERYRAAVDEAIAVYERIAATGRPAGGR